MQATNCFDDLLRETLADLVGGPLSDWAWLKASLPSYRGGIDIMRVSLHAPAAYIDFIIQSKFMLAGILGHTPQTSKYLAAAISLLAKSVKRADWVLCT